jgi:predicted kinase
VRRPSGIQEGRRSGATGWPNHVVVSKDLMPNNKRKERRQRALIEEALAAGEGVVVDNTNPGQADRAPLIDLGRTYGAEVVGFYFHPQILCPTSDQAPMSAMATCEA